MSQIETLTLPECELDVFEIICAADGINPNSLIQLMGGYQTNEIRYLIRRLKEKELIRSVPNLMDMRSVIYYPNVSNEEKERILGDRRTD